MIDLITLRSCKLNQYYLREILQMKGIMIRFFYGFIFVLFLNYIISWFLNLQMQMVGFN